MCPDLAFGKSEIFLIPGLDTISDNRNRFARRAVLLIALDFFRHCEAKLCVGRIEPIGTRKARRDERNPPIELARTMMVVDRNPKRRITPAGPRLARPVGFNPPYELTSST